MIIDTRIDDGESEEISEEEIAMTPLTGLMNRKSERETLSNTQFKPIDLDLTCCIKFQANSNSIKSDLASFLKQLPKEILESASKMLNMDHTINNLIYTINKAQKDYFKAQINKESQSISIFQPPSIRNSPEFEAVHKFVEAEWMEQFKQSFYYIQEGGENISQWMLRMMKDKTSFWFDHITYEKIRNDYKRVRQDYNNYVDDQKMVENSKKAKRKKSTNASALTRSRGTMQKEVVTPPISAINKRNLHSSNNLPQANTVNLDLKIQLPDDEERLAEFEEQLLR